MSPRFLRSKDFWGGAMLAATGLGAIVTARGYPFGSVLRMGPGYFPTILGVIILAFGLVLVARALRSDELIAGNWSLRALIMLPAALILFGLLMDRAGFVPALAILIFVSAAAGPSFRFAEVAVLTAALTAFCVLVFVWGLGLPYRLLAGF